MTNAAIIKKVLGPYLQGEGFQYAGYDVTYHGWKFKREKGDITHWLCIAKSRWGKEIWLEAGAAEGERWRKRPCVVVRLNWFKKDATHKEMEKYYEDEATLEEALECFLTQIKDYIMPGFEKLEEKDIKWEITDAMYERLKEEKELLLENLFSHYGMLSMDEGKMLPDILAILEEHQHDSMEEFQDTLLGLAALFGEIMVKGLEDCHWDPNWKGKGYYVFHKEVYKGPMMEMNRIYYLSPLEIMNRAWQKYGKENPEKWYENILEFWYESMFVERRRQRKTLSEERKHEPEGINQYTFYEEGLSPIMERYCFQHIKDKSRIGLRDEWYRDTPGGRQEILLYCTNAGNWLSAVTEDGREVEIQDVREGLYPYEREIYCYNSVMTEKLLESIEKFKEQIEREFLPFLENGESSLLKWELTPDMERREFFERDRLLKGLKEKYRIGTIEKQELPGLIKGILKENEDSTMEEFGDTLLGLGVLLGEAAIKEIEGSHWLWDVERSACLVTYRNEVTGIDPAFSLNYAWQKKKPENVDKLYRDLMEGNYIEDRERGGYIIEEG